MILIISSKDLLGYALYIPKNEGDFWNLIETEFRDLLVGLSKGENLFREKYTDILNKIKNIEKRIERNS